MLEFEFNGHSSKEYGIVIADIEENDDLESRSLILGEKNKYKARENHFGTKYEKNYSFNIKIIKDYCQKDTLPSLTHNYSDSLNIEDIEKKDVRSLENMEIGSIENEKDVLVYPEISDRMYLDDGVLRYPPGYDISLRRGLLTSQHEDYFTSNDIRSLNAWLMSPQFPKLFKFHNNDYFMEDIEYFVTITEVKTEHSDNPYQLTYTVTCDSPYGYTPLQSQKISSTKSYISEIILFNTSDCKNEYVYPLVKIFPTKPGKIKLSNQSDSGINELVLDIDEEHLFPFYMDCENLILYKKDETDISFDEIGINGDTINNLYWLRLCWGINKIQLNGDAIVEITWREPRKVGIF